MKSLALGLIEVMGYTAAIEAADAAVKSAQVTLISVTKVQGGLVTVLLRGEVAPVQAAVDSASAAVAKMSGTLLGVHVIPRPDDQVDAMIQQDLKCFSEKEEPPSASGISSKAEIPAETQPFLTKEGSAGASDFREIQRQFPKESPQEEKHSLKKEKLRHPNHYQELKNKKSAPLQIPVPSQESLSKMTVSNLRKLARLLDLTGMDRNAIKFARKEQLLEKIQEYKNEKEGKEE